MIADELRKVFEVEENMGESSVMTVGLLSLEVENREELQEVVDSMVLVFLEVEEEGLKQE